MFSQWQNQWLGSQFQGLRCFGAGKAREFRIGGRLKKNISIFEQLKMWETKPLDVRSLHVQF